MSQRIGPKQFHDSDGVEEWRVLGEGACAYFITGSFAASAALVAALGDIPDLDVTTPTMDVPERRLSARYIRPTRRR